MPRQKVGDDGRGTPTPGSGGAASSANNSGRPKRKTPMRNYKKGYYGEGNSPMKNYKKGYYGA